MAYLVGAGHPICHLRCDTHDRLGTVALDCIMVPVVML